MSARPLVVALLTLTGAQTSTAQPPLKPEDGKLVLRMTVDATSAPAPALKHPLLPELRESQPGNQIPAFYKCFFEQNNFFFGPESEANREKWLVAPLAELADVKELIGYGGSGLRQADYAARLDAVDWQFITQLKADGINALLPDVQQLRRLAAALKVRMRGEVARKEFPAAVRTAQTLFALARTFNNHPTLIGQLVGAAITAITLEAVEEFVQQPGAPNLFWSLTGLPAPFIDLRVGMQGERTWTEKDFGPLRKPDPLTEAELMRMVKALDQIIRSEGSRADTRRPDWAEGLAADPAVFAVAKERLVKSGFKPVAVEKMPRLQVYLADEFLQYETLRDDLMKWTNVPYWKIPAEVDRDKLLPLGGFAALVPSVRKVFQNQVRIQQRLDLLKVVEAVRLYAAANGGAVPATLDAVPLPLPVDPVTGKPFVYEVTDGKAVIRATPPPERKNEPQFNRVYEVTIRK